MSDPREPIGYVDGVPVRRCMQSGMCCKKGPCAFGEWDAAAHQCRFLEVEERGEGWTRYRCGIKDRIDALPESAGAKYNPAFGAGCCMPMFNDNRAALIRHRLTEVRRDT